MSHITIIINRESPPTITSNSEGIVSLVHHDPVAAKLTFAVPDEASDEEVGKAVRKLYKQVRDLGN